MAFHLIDPDPNPGRRDEMGWDYEERGRLGLSALNVHACMHECMNEPVLLNGLALISMIPTLTNRLSAD